MSAVEYKACDNPQCFTVCVADRLGETWCKLKVKPWLIESHACSRDCAAVLLALSSKEHELAVRENFERLRAVRSIVTVPAAD